MAVLVERLFKSKTDLLLNPRSTRRKLRLTLIGFALLISIPIALILHRTYSQMKTETLVQYRVASEEVVAQLNQRLFEVLKPEEDRPFEDYRFFKVADPAKNIFNLSPLSTLSTATGFPGVIGYFQVEPDGRFTSPVFPDVIPAEANLKSLGIETAELEQRRILREQLHRSLDVLSAHRESTPPQAKKPATVAMTPVRARTAISKDKDEMYVRKSFLGGIFDSARMSAEVKQADHEEIQDAPAAYGGVAANAGGAAGGGGAGSDSLNKSGSVTQERQNFSQELSKALPSQANLATQKLEQRAPRKSIVNVLEKQDIAQEENSFYWPGQKQSQGKRKMIQAKVALPETAPPSPAVEFPATRATSSRIQITQFEAEIDPLQMIVLPDGKLAFFRKVWRNEKKFIQGFILNQEPFFRHLLEGSFYTSALSAENSLTLFHDRQQLANYNPAAGYQTRSYPLNFFRTFLAPPLNKLELRFSTQEIRHAAGRAVLNFVTALIILVFLVGFFGIYRLAIGQIEIAMRQNDFVSAVSHELKTPLTSIRMYAEMLKSGIAVDPAKQTSYLDFILSESERLSRLISNVLQLARLSKGVVSGEVKEVRVSTLLDLIQSKVGSQIRHAGFEFKLQKEASLDSLQVRVEEDRFLQIFINLADNAIKFSKDAKNKTVEIGVRPPAQRDGKIIFFVRDFGPGVPKSQMKKIFQLFYRAGDEMTRKTPGTGIGLGLVRQLAHSLGGEVDLRNLEPGVEFQVILPAIHIAQKRR